MGKNSKKNEQAATPVATQQQPMQTIQPAMPGQLDALSQQLAAGFGQSAPDMLSYLQQFYKPMQVPDYSQRPAAATPPPAVTPSPTPVKRGGQAALQPVDRTIFNRSRGGGS